MTACATSWGHILQPSFDISVPVETSLFAHFWSVYIYVYIWGLRWHQKIAERILEKCNLKNATQLDKL